MKKIISLAVAALLIFSCITTAFAAQTATPDEAKKVTALTLTKLPNKLEYNVADDVVAEIDGKPIADLDIFGLTEDEAMDKISRAVIDIKINMDGAEITAEYADGSTAVIDAKDCEVKVTNPLTGAQIVDKMKAFQEELKKLGMNDETEPDEEQLGAFMELSERYVSELNALICRDYNVEVTYGGQSAEFSVKLKLPEIPDLPFSDYEFVSLEEPAPKTYYMSRDVEEEDFDVEGVKEYHIKFDTSKMTVKARNIETGEIIEISGDNIELDYTFFSDDEMPETGKYTAYGFAYDQEKDCYVSFEYEFYFVNDLNKTPSQPKNNDKTSTKDEATPAQAASNGAVQTGGEITVILPMLVVLLSVAAVYASYRKRENK